MAGSISWAPDVAALALRMDAEGASVAEIARATKHTRSAAAGFLRRQGLAGRRQPRQTPDPIMDRLKDSEVLWALRRRDAGVSSTQIGKRLGLNVTAVIRMFAAIDRDLAASEAA